MELKSNRNRFFATAVVASILVCFTTSVVSPQGSTMVSTSINGLAWMAGSWQTAPGGRRSVEEHWMAPAGGTMFGMGRTVVGDRTVEFEYLRLEQREDGIYYVASPKGRCPSTDFKMTRQTSKEAVFENPAHDFPKRITYRRDSDGSMTATVDGGPGTKGQTFSYKRMS